MADPIKCPDCDATFPTPQAVGAHRFRAHGYRSPESLRRQALGQAPKNSRKRKRATANPAATRSAAPTLAGLAGEVRGNVDAIVLSLTGQLETVEQRLVVIDNEARDLRHLRTEIGAALKRLTAADSPNGDQPDAAKRPKNQGVIDGNRRRAEAQLAVKVAAVERLLTTNRAAWAEGFTSNQLADTLRAQVPGGLSPKSARQVLDALRERGVVRHDRVVKGGGMQFKLTGVPQNEPSVPVP